MTCLFMVFLRIFGAVTKNRFNMLIINILNSGTALMKRQPYLLNEDNRYSPNEARTAAFGDSLGNKNGSVTQEARMDPGCSG